MVWKNANSNNQSFLERFEINIGDSSKILFSSTSIFENETKKTNSCEQKYVKLLSKENMKIYFKMWKT